MSYENKGVLLTKQLHSRPIDLVFGKELIQRIMVKQKLVDTIIDRREYQLIRRLMEVKIGQGFYEREQDVFLSRSWNSAI